MRVLQVGLGGFGRGWASLVRETAEVELVGVADADPAAQAWMTSNLGLPATAYFASLEQALATIACDAVLIVTPPETHRRLAVPALEAGKPVLVEKPLATTLADARTLVATAARTGQTLMVSQNYRFRRPARAAQRIVAEGHLGNLAAVTIRCRRDTRTLFPPENFRYTMRHPYVVDMSIHHADLLRAIIGQEVRRVYARGWRVPRSNYQHDPAVIATMTLETGVTVIYEGTWATNEAETSWNGDWEIIGERGRLTWTGGETDPLQGTITLQLWGEAPREVPQPELERVDRRGTFDAFRRAIIAGEEPETSARDNINSLAIVLACVESLDHDLVATVGG